MSNDADKSATQRWWLNPALARLAFGNSTLGARHPPETARSAMRNALLHGTGGLDLDDPEQREFGDYELLELVGQGGMGVVYRARQRELDREVAIKVLSAGQDASEEFVESFRHEAQNAALLQHPNIVIVHEMGEHAGLIFYAMQLVRGRSLSQRLDQDGTLPPREAAALLRTVAEAVDYAHRLGVLHLDLKPGNILLDAQDEPMVADFGLARRLEQALDNERVTGTPSYMAPEQARLHGPALSRATDVWALGAMLYEMLTGQPPFEGGDPAATLRHLLELEVRSPKRYAAVPPDLEAICMRCLAKDPNQRYPDARSLVEDLTRYLEGREVSVRPLTTLQRIGRWARREPRLATVASLAVAALLVGVTATTVQWRRADTNATTASAHLWDSRGTEALRLEMDGKGFAALPLLLANIEGQEEAGRDDLAAVERRRVGMLLARAPTLIDIARIDDASLLAAEISPDGRLFALAFNDMSVRWYGTDDMRERGRVDLLGVPTSDGAQRAPMLLRFDDNQRLRVTLEWMGAFVNAPGSDSHLVDLERGMLIEPPPQFAELADITYSADGRHALLRNREAQVQLWQVDPWRPLSPLAQTSTGNLPWLLAPGAGYAVTLVPANHELLVFDPHDLSRARRVALPGDKSITAWAASRNGRWMALGDFDGRVMLLDTRDWNLRQLSASLGKQTQWLAFSEDSAWLASVNLLGTAQAFDVTTGDALVAGQMPHDFTPSRVAISHAQNMLVVTGDGRAGIWRLPASGTQTRKAKRLGAGLSGDTLAGFYGVGFSAASGLLANTSLDGEVRLWRLPAPLRLPARAPYWRPETQHYDGHHVVDVAWNRLRLLSTRDGTSSDWISLPQPPVFAELVGPGNDLVVVSGHELRIFDAETLRLRHPPRPLRETPIRFAASDDGRTLVLGYTDSGPQGSGEHLESWDLASGKRMAEAVMAGPLRQLQVSPDGRRLLAVSRSAAKVEMLDASTLKHMGRYQADANTPPLWASFGSTSNIAYLLMRARDPRLDNDAVLVWDGDAQRLLERRPTFRANPIGVADAGGKPFVAGRNLNLLDPGQPGTLTVPRLSPRVEPLARVVPSHDGTLLAQAYRSEVQLYDAASGDPVGPPLFADSNSIDVISQVAFSPDDQQLLARSAQGHWWRFRIPVDARPVAEIRRQSRRLNRDDNREQDNQATSSTPDLRKRDHGEWGSMPAARPSIPPSGYSVMGLPIPARAVDASPLLLDLAPACNVAPDTVMDSEVEMFAEARSTAAPGIVRVDGIDYDVRCSVLLHGLGGAGTSGRGQAVSTAISVPPVPIAAFRVLVWAAQPVPGDGQPVYARLRVRYRDGGSAVLPLYSGRQIASRASPGSPVRVAWVLHDPAHLFGIDRRFEIDNPRLPNPEPERLVESLTLESAAQHWSTPVFFAITAETVDTAPADALATANPVIPGRGPRTFKYRQGGPGTPAGGATPLATNQR